MKTNAADKHLILPSRHQALSETSECVKIVCDALHLRRTHGDVGQFVSGAVRVDAVKVRTITVHSTQDQSSTNVALIPEQTQLSSTFKCLYISDTFSYWYYNIYDYLLIWMTGLIFYSTWFRTLICQIFILSINNFLCLAENHRSHGI